MFCSSNLHFAFFLFLQQKSKLRLKSKIQEKLFPLVVFCCYSLHVIMVWLNSDNLANLDLNRHTWKLELNRFLLNYNSIDVDLSRLFNLSRLFRVSNKLIVVGFRLGQANRHNFCIFVVFTKPLFLFISHLLSQEFKGTVCRLLNKTTWLLF